jgi:hypothetical protein
MLEPERRVLSLRPTEADEPDSVIARRHLALTHQINQTWQLVAEKLKQIG